VVGLQTLATALHPVAAYRLLAFKWSKEGAKCKT